MEVAGKWDDIFPNAKKEREDQEEKGFIFSQKYLVFAGATADPRARELLEQWTQAVRRKVVPPAAGLGEHAAANGLREFIEGINAQVELAIKGPQQPKPRNIP